VYKRQVFLSYSSKDEEVIKNIVSDFKSHGVITWVDFEKITYGDSVTKKIETGLENSKYIVVVLSKNLGKSNWCRAEYGPILNKEYSGKSDKKVIPLRLDDCSDEEIPLLLYDKSRAEYTNKEDYMNLIRFLKL